MEILIKKPLEVLKTQLKSGSYHIMHGRRSSGIIVVLHGRMEFVFDEISIPCEYGHGIYIPEGAEYTIRSYECSENRVFNFYDEAERVPVPIEISDTGAIERLFDETERELLKSNCSQNKVFSLFYQVLSELFDKSTYLETGEKYVRLAEDIIVKSVSDASLSCRMIADRISVSEVYLRKLFAKHREISPSRYIQNIRMSKAQAYLSDGYPVGETAEMVGYSDIYQFSRVYKKHFGYSPRATAQKNKL